MLLGPNRAENFGDSMFITPEKFKGILNSKMDHVTRATPLSGTISRPKAKIWHSLHGHKIWRY